MRGRCLSLLAMLHLAGPLYGTGDLAAAPAAVSSAEDSVRAAGGPAGNDSADLERDAPAAPKDGTVGTSQDRADGVEAKLNRILDLLIELKRENERLAAEVAALLPLREELAALRSGPPPAGAREPAPPPPGTDAPQAAAAVRPPIPAPAALPAGIEQERSRQQDILWRAPSSSSTGAEGHRKFTLMDLNVGPDDSGDVSYSGKARFFAPFNEHQALQAQGGYRHYRGQREGQFDLGLVNRYRNLQLGLFSSWTYVNLPGFLNGAALGQAALTLDFLFRGGRVGMYGTRGLKENVVVDRRKSSMCDPADGSATGSLLCGEGSVHGIGAVTGNNFVRERYLNVIDQIGISGQLPVIRDSYLEASLSWLNGELRNAAGGTVRYVYPLGTGWALTAEGGWNETLLSHRSTGRFAVGLQLGRWLRPAEFRGLAHPVPVDVPNLRYEVLTRTVRTGNDAPVADAGPDQLGVEPGTIVLDGSASYDPDGDPLSFQWSQSSGPPVSLSSTDTAQMTFTAEAGATYLFRLNVSDGQGAKAFDDVTVSSRKPDPAPRILSFSATPQEIEPGQTATLIWRVENASIITLSEVGTVEPAGQSAVSPAQTTTYTLTAANARGETVHQTVVVRVTECVPVQILNFTADPSETPGRGERVRLSWQTRNAEKVIITGIGEVEADGERFVFPDGDTSYTLLAYGCRSEISAVVVIHVRNRKPVADAGHDFETNQRTFQLDGSGSHDPDGDPIKFRWKVVSPNLDVLILDPQSVQPTVTINGPAGSYVFELTVIDDRGAVCVDTVVVSFCL